MLNDSDMHTQNTQSGSPLRRERSHIIITGTGRAGTTFLVQLLTNLGLDTGFDSSNMALFPNCNAGLELNIFNENAPYIIKSPRFCSFVDEVLARPDIKIRHVYIPMRDLYAAAESRRHVTKRSLEALNTELRGRMRLDQIPGGLEQTENPEAQEFVLLMQIYKLLLSLSKTAVPITLLHYPMITTDAHYLYSKLKAILGTVDFNIFEQVYTQTVRPELVHKFGEGDY